MIANALRSPPVVSRLADAVAGSPAGRTSLVETLAGTRWIAMTFPP